MTRTWWKVLRPLLIGLTAGLVLDLVLLQIPDRVALGALLALLLVALVWTVRMMVTTRREIAEVHEVHEQWLKLLHCTREDYEEHHQALREVDQLNRDFRK